MNKIILIGGGDHCKSVIDVIEQQNQFEIAGVVDKQELLGSKILGYQVIGNDFDLESLAKKRQLKAYKHKGFWYSIDTKRDKENLEVILKNKKIPWE